MREFFVSDGRKKDWFWLDNEVFEMNLDPYSFMVYAYLAYSEDDNSEAAVSPEEIQKALGLSEERIQKSLKELEEKRMVIKEVKDKKIAFVLTSKELWKKEGIR